MFFHIIENKFKKNIKKQQKDTRNKKKKLKESLCFLL